MDAKNIQALLTEADGFYSAHSDVMNLVCGLAAALKASEERARKAEAMYRQRDADVTAWQRTATDLYTGNPPSEPSMAAGLKLMQEHMRQRDQAKACIQKAEQDRHALAVANLAANKRIVELEHERDAARADFARLTTPRPIAEAPRDGTWVLLPFSTSKWDACRGPSPQYVTARWFAAAWADPNGALLTEPSHYLPLPDVKP